MNKGNGTFAPKTDYAIGDPSGDVVLGYFDGDGKLDVLAVGADPIFVPNDGASLMLGKGDGTFAPPTQYAFGATSGYAAVADWNGDGKPDLAITSPLGGSVDVLLNQGVVIAPLVAPTATLLPLATVAAHTRTYSFSVVYSGASPLDATTFDNRDILVSGPNNFSAYASVTSIASGKGHAKIVTYSFLNPGGKNGRWGKAYNGKYTIALQGQQVRNVSGGYAASALLGRFKVALTV